jgi:hypothetical protein
MRRSIRMPETADLQSIKAKYENGVLNLDIPKHKVYCPLMYTRGGFFLVYVCVGVHVCVWGRKSVYVSRDSRVKTICYACMVPPSRVRPLYLVPRTRSCVTLGIQSLSQWLTVEI